MEGRKSVSVFTVEMKRMCVINTWWTQFPYLYFSCVYTVLFSQELWVHSRRYCVCGRRKCSKKKEISFCYLVLQDIKINIFSFLGDDSASSECVAWWMAIQSDRVGGNQSTVVRRTHLCVLFFDIRPLCSKDDEAFFSSFLLLSIQFFFPPFGIIIIVEDNHIITAIFLWHLYLEFSLDYVFVHLVSCYVRMDWNGLVL